MSYAKLAVACGLIAVTLVVSACGIQAKPVAGTKDLYAVAGNHAVDNDPRTKHLSCLRDKGFKVTEFLSGRGKYPALQINRRPSGPTIVFTPTPGIAEGNQMQGQQGFEVIGAALVYPNRTTDKTMLAVEGCLTIGVSG